MTPREHRRRGLDVASSYGLTISPVVERRTPRVARSAYGCRVGSTVGGLAKIARRRWTRKDGGSVYATNSCMDEALDTVSQYDVGAGGALSPKSPPTVAAGYGPFGVAVNPDGDSVYVGNLGSDTVSQYDVGAGGALSPKSPPTVAAVDNPFGVAVSHNG